jgi:hypothetical protein
MVQPVLTQLPGRLGDKTGSWSVSRNQQRRGVEVWNEVVEVKRRNVMDDEDRCGFCRDGNDQDQTILAVLACPWGFQTAGTA